MKRGRPSRTAIVVAKAQAVVGSDAAAGSLVPPESLDFAKHALEVAGYGGFVRRLRSHVFRGAMKLYEKLMIPGLARHQVLRKNIIEAQVRSAMRSGVRRVIQVGSGFDSLCYRLHREWPEIDFVEFDHPSTQLVKREVIESLECATNLRLRPLDLGDANPGPFAEEVGSVPSIIVVEGVLIYLPSELVALWLSNWAKGSHPDSRFLFTFMDSVGFRDQSFAVNWWLRHFGEPFQWHISVSHLSNFLRRLGWEPEAVVSTWSEGDENEIARGEWICEAKPVPPPMTDGELENRGIGESRVWSIG